MLPEIAILRYILLYNNYNIYYKYININKDIYKELYFIYNLLPSFFEKYPKDASVDDFALFFFTHYQGLRPEEKDAYTRIFEQAKTSEVSEETIRDYLKELDKRATAFSVAKKALQIAEGTSSASLEELFPASTFAGQMDDEEYETQFITDDLHLLLDSALSESGLRWRLPSLNRSLGSLRRGDFGFIFSRPETGKTTFLASEATFFAGQTERPILWFNNEEQGNKVKLRCFQAALGVPLASLIAEKDKYKNLYMQLTGGRIKIYDSGTIFKVEAEQIIEEMQPALIVFDQIDKIKGFDADRNDLMMGAIYQWARELAKEYAPVIGVCQADGTGEGVKWLTMSHVAEAKTAKQAEADWILGIGKSHDEALRQIRHFNVSKNKLIGDTDTDPIMRHGGWDVIIQPEIARYKDLGE